MSTPTIKYLVLPGGFPLDTGRDGDIGYDIQIRAIVSTERDPNTPYMLQTIWDIRSAPPERLVRNARHNGTRWLYLLQPNQTVHLGVGVVLGGDSVDWCAHTRSSTALRQVSVKNFMDDVIWDPNYRGEGLIFLKNEGSDSIEICHGWKPASMVFRPKHSPEGCWARPNLVRAYSYDDLGKTNRMAEWKGSSDRLKGLQLELDILAGPDSFNTRPLPSQLKNPFFWNAPGMPT